MGRWAFSRKIKKKKEKSFIKIAINIVLYITILLIISFSSIKIIDTLNTRGLEIVFDSINVNMSVWINEAIQIAISDTTKNMEITANDFLIKTFDVEGRYDSLVVDTVLVNMFINEVSTRLSEVLLDNNIDKVYIPIGIFFGIEALANKGPMFPVSIYPMSNVTVDYETAINSVGINQTNFEVYLNINSFVKIVNPLQETTANVSRKVAIVNTVIRGEVPSQYIDGYFD